MKKFKKLKILVDFEDAFTSFSGIPNSLVNDVLCLILAGYDLILWYSDNKNSSQVVNWINTYFDQEQKSRIYLMQTRPTNFHLWVAQVFPYFCKQEIQCDLVYCSLFPRLPVKGNAHTLIRLYDPFGTHKSFFATFFMSLIHKDSFKNSLARAIRTYSFLKSSKSNQIKVYSSQTIQKTFHKIYNYETTNDKVIYPIVQFAVDDLIKRKNSVHVVENHSNYFVFIGGQRQKKDPLSILKLWSKNLNLYNFNFVVIGKIDDEIQPVEVQDAVKSNRLKITHGIATFELRSIIENSLGVVYNTQPDGFGYPVAEGIYLNKYVICNDIEVFREIGGDYPYFFKSGNYHEALSILQNIANGFLRKKTYPKVSFKLDESIEAWIDSISYL